MKYGRSERLKYRGTLRAVDWEYMRLFHRLGRVFLEKRIRVDGVYFSGSQLSNSQKAQGELTLKRSWRYKGNVHQVPC